MRGGDLLKSYVDLGMVTYLNSNFGISLQGASVCILAQTFVVKKEGGLVLLTKPNKPLVELRILYSTSLK
jgi:hypothetical protein